MSFLQEPALEPEMAIIDPHHHLYDRPTVRYLFRRIARRHAERP